MRSTPRWLACGAVALTGMAVPAAASGHALSDPAPPTRRPATVAPTPPPPACALPLPGRPPKDLTVIHLHGRNLMDALQRRAGGPPLAIVSLGPAAQGSHVTFVLLAAPLPKGVAAVGTKDGTRALSVLGACVTSSK